MTKDRIFCCTAQMDRLDGRGATPRDTPRQDIMVVSVPGNARETTAGGEPGGASWIIAQKIFVLAVSGPQSIKMVPAEVMPAWRLKTKDAEQALARSERYHRILTCLTIRITVKLAANSDDFSMTQTSISLSTRYWVTSPRPSLMIGSSESEH